MVGKKNKTRQEAELPSVVTSNNLAPLVEPPHKSTNDCCPKDAISRALIKPY